MDSISQAALGAAIGQVVLGRKLGRKAMLWGAVVATIPDLDIVLLPIFNDIEKISIHRGLSHSFLFVIGLSFILAFFSQRWQKSKRVSYSRWLMFFVLALGTHLLLDACTSYGTQLFLPFSDMRVGFDIVSIVDPVYTMPLLLGISFSLRSQTSQRKRRNYNLTGLIMSSAYLLFAFGIKQKVNTELLSSASRQNISPLKTITIPVSSMSMLWYGVIKTNEGLYIGNYSLFDPNASMRFEFFPTNEDMLGPIKDSWLENRLKWFANDFYTVDDRDGHIQFYNLKCDMTGSAGKDNVAPTTFYYDINYSDRSEISLTAQMHSIRKSNSFSEKWQRIFHSHRLRENTPILE